MYKYCATVEIENAVELSGDFLFQVVIKEKMSFKIIDCFFQVIKNHDSSFKISDSILVMYFSELRDFDGAKMKIKRAIEFFVFMTGIPFDVSPWVIESIGGDIPILNNELSKKKMMEITEANRLYNKVRTKKNLLEKVLQMYSVAIKENFLLAQNKEDAFFTYFKIIEIIVKDDFSIEKQRIDKGTIQTKQYIELILSQVYGVRTQNKRVDELCGNIKNRLFKLVFCGNDNIYHKTAWFMQRKNIRFDKDLLANIVLLRNRIAHGENVEMEKHQQEYIEVMSLTKNVIDAKFFGKELQIDSRQIIL